VNKTKVCQLPANFFKGLTAATEPENRSGSESRQTPMDRQTTVLTGF